MAGRERGNSPRRKRTLRNSRVAAGWTAIEIAARARSFGFIAVMMLSAGSAFVSVPAAAQAQRRDSTQKSAARRDSLSADSLAARLQRAEEAIATLKTQV